MIKLDLRHIKGKNLVNFNTYQKDVKKIHSVIHKRTGLGSEYLGWLDYPFNYDKNEFRKIQKVANEFKKKYTTLVVCGIGGSYLGARAAIDAINGLHPKKGKMEIIYLGNTLGPSYISQTMDYLENKNYAVCVISKSGTTTETAIGFRLLQEQLIRKYGKKNIKNRIVAVTDKKNGALKKLCDKEGYETFVLPSNIGGRFSVITPVGLFPMACAGLNIEHFMEGFKDATEEYSNPDLHTNDAFKYAVERFHLYKLGYSTEMMVSYEMQYKMLIEWWKQLFDESEGKLRKALLAASAIFTTDLHSMGQFIQDGSKVLFETTIYVERPSEDVVIKKDKDNLDELNYLAGKKLSFINKKAFEATVDAHSNDGDVPNIIITLDKMDSHNIGELMCFFMHACAMSAYLLDVNPFNQPGVEIYKKNMFHLLGKKGY